MNTLRTNSPQFISLFRYPLQSSTLALPKSLLSAMATPAESPAENLPILSSATANGEPEPTAVDASAPPPPAEAPEELVDEDAKFGFKRSEMYKESLPVKDAPYDRHVFLAFKSALSWPARVEDVAYDPLPGRLALAMKKRKDEMPRLTLFTVIEGGAESGVSDGDVLIFPDMIKYKNLTQEAVDDFVEDILIKESTSTKFGSPEKLTGFHMFVCAHTSRDKRCGVCGPVLIDKLNTEIELRGLKNKVFVSPCSHVGGHKYAGNVIVFGPNSEEKVMGHWYGYVTPDDVPLLLEQHVGKGELVKHLWRGEYCQPYVSKIQESKLESQQTDAVPYLNGTNGENNVEESTTKGSIQNGGSCCQEGTTGFTCCRDATVDLDVNAADSKSSKNGACARGFGKISSWVGKLEQADVLLGVGVIGAVATVAVAYNIYRRSG